MPKTYSREEIEQWNRMQDRAVEEMRKTHSQLLLEDHRKLIEAIEKATGLPKHSHRFTHRALHPEKYM